MLLCQLGRLGATPIWAGRACYDGCVERHTQTDTRQQLGNMQFIEILDIEDCVIQH